MLAKLFRKNLAKHNPASITPPMMDGHADSPAEATVSSYITGDQIEEDIPSRSSTSDEIEPRVTVHYGIPSTASTLAFDPIQSLLAVGTLDGRIKVIGGSNVEALLTSSKQQPLKYLQFIQNQGFLISVSNDNEIQAWDLEHRRIVSAIQWESSLTAFSTITGSSFFYVGDEFGMVSVLYYNVDDVKLEIMPYYVPTDSIGDSMECSSFIQQSVVGLLPQSSYDEYRLLIAFQDGLLVLWDISQEKVIKVKRSKDLQVGRCIIVDHGDSVRNQSNVSFEYDEDKEVCSLCWISSNGPILAVGYDDGDILLWNLSPNEPRDGRALEKAMEAIKIQLSTGDRNLPVIVLKWSETKSRHNNGGQLFVYGGDAIGSEEVLTILSLDWSSGFESLECVNRVNLVLNGSFADMILLQSEEHGEHTGVIMLTYPGELRYYDEEAMSSIRTANGKIVNCSSVNYPTVIQTTDPYLTMGKLVSITDGSPSAALVENIKNIERSTMQTQLQWPLKGGVPIQMTNRGNLERIYIAGYQDGSVRMWDATYPHYSLINCIFPVVEGFDQDIVKASVSALDFCSVSFSLAVGSDIGTVRVYSFDDNQNDKSTTIVTDMKKEVHHHEVDWNRCTAVFSISKSSVSTISFATSGSRLAVGFTCGRVAMLDISTSSVLFLVECSSSSISSISFKPFSAHPLSSDSSRTEGDNNEMLIISSSDGTLVSVGANSGTKMTSHFLQQEGNSTVISIHCLDGFSSMKSSKTTEEDSGTETPSEVADVQRRFDDLVLMCCTTVLHLFTLKALDEGDRKLFRSVDILKACWCNVFEKSDAELGLIVLYESGAIEIRGLPNLEVIGKTSLMTLLRWNFKPNMEKTICSSPNAQIMMINGCEYASISLLASENDLRIPESLPCLHDHVLAAAPNDPSHKKEGSSIFDGLRKGIQALKDNRVKPSSKNYAHLGSIFSTPPFLKPSTLEIHNDDVVELSIDDIDIDGPVLVADTSAGEGKTERERLLEDASKDVKPIQRTAEEIRAKYRKEDPSTAAARARDKLAERQEKLERLSMRTQELQSGAENFSSMANELAKQMEKRKWWNL